MLRRWAKRVRASRNWIKALELSSSGRYSEALALIQSIEEASDNKSAKPTEFDVQVQLLRVMLLVNTAIYQGALAALKGLDPVLMSNTSAEGNYLRGYASLLLRAIMAATHSQSLDEGLTALSQFNLKSIDQSKVPAHLRRKFPILAADLM